MKTETITIPSFEADLYPAICIPKQSILMGFTGGESIRPVFGHNCRNCGAPLNVNGDCEYCGTVRNLQSIVHMDGDSISFYCG